MAWERPTSSPTGPAPRRSAAATASDTLGDPSVPRSRHRLVPPRRHRRRLGGGGTWGRALGAARVRRRDRGRRRSRRPPPARDWPCDAPRPPTATELDAALAGRRRRGRREPLLDPAEPAGRPPGGVGVLRGRPAILHHHDLPWQRARFAHIIELPPDDPAWRHVTINDLTRPQLAEPRHRGRHDLQRLRRRPVRRATGIATRAALGGRPRTTPAAGASRPGHGPQGRPRRHRAWPSRSAPSTGCSARPRTATGPSSNGCWPRPRAAWSTAASGRDHGRRLRRLRRGGASRRRGRASATRRSRRRCTAGRSPSAGTRWPRSCGRSGSVGSPPTTRPRSARSCADPTRPCSTTTGPSPAGTSRSSGPDRTQLAALLDRGRLAPVSDARPVGARRPGAGQPGPHAPGGSSIGKRVGYALVRAGDRRCSSSASAPATPALRDPDDRRRPTSSGRLCSAPAIVFGYGVKAAEREDRSGRPRLTRRSSRVDHAGVRQREADHAPGLRCATARTSRSRSRTSRSRHPAPAR